MLGCSKTLDMALKPAALKRLAGADQALYLKQTEFCTRYHTHARGEKVCK